MSASPSLLQTVRDEVRALDPSVRALRQFGLVVGGVLLAVAGLTLWRRGPGAVVWTLGGVGGALVVLGSVAPVVLRPVRTAWMALAFALGFVMTRVLLTAAFALAVVPVAVGLRLLGKDPLHRRPEPSAETYWIDRADGRPDRESLERYF
ncbi:SxtJ family membrane protein [Rubrivirga sp.]|uniref:SxtJ family membrane protein n=1 Tax=Rubrivirga sp. TaxID=1885344 RepID=UPI003B52EC2B